MKYIKIIVIIMLCVVLTPNLFADQIITENELENITEQQINEYITPRQISQFYWNENKLNVDIEIPVVRQINNDESNYELTTTTYIPQVPINLFYTCYIKENVHINTCIQYLIYDPSPFTYQGVTYYSMYYNLMKRVKLEKQRVKDYIMKIKEKKIMNDVLNNINQDQEVIE
jgi:hypothetical protein